MCSLKIVPRTSGCSNSGKSKSGTAVSWYPLDGWPAISTPKVRSCCTSRHTSERVDADLLRQLGSADYGCRIIHQHADNSAETLIGLMFVDLRG